MPSSSPLLEYAPARHRKRANLGVAVAVYWAALADGFSAVAAELCLTRPALREALPTIPIFEALNTIRFVPGIRVSHPRGVLILFAGLAGLGLILSFARLRPSAQAGRWPYLCAAAAGPETLAVWRVVAKVSLFHSYLDSLMFLYGAHCLALVMTSFLTAAVLLWASRRTFDRATRMAAPRWTPWRCCDIRIRFHEQRTVNLLIRFQWWRSPR